jgi:Transcriptional regulator
MAHRPESEQQRLLAQPLEALTPFSPCDPEALTGILTGIRSRGWELGINDVVEGLTSLGVPVHDRTGAVIGAVSISGLHAHIVDGDRPRHLAILQRKMQELANAVG